MKIITEKSLRDFEFWSGGADRANNCSSEELDSIEEFLEEIEPEDGWTDTAINDFFWFGFDTIAQHLGYKDEADFDRQHDPDYIDDDDLKDEIIPWFENLVNEALNKRTQEDINFIVGIALNLLNYDGELDDEDEYTEKDFINCANFLLDISDANELYDGLFYDDCGEYETDGLIPSWEDFRDEIMIQKKHEQ